jgi:hypothetical protein
VAAFADNLSSYGLPGFLAQPTAVMGPLVSGEDLFEHTPVSAIKEAGNRPIYIVHSHSDRRISIGRT